MQFDTADKLLAYVKSDLWPKWRDERRRLDRIDKWLRWDHEKPTVPRGTSTREYQQLADSAQAPWGGLVVSAVAQGLYVEGYRQAKAKDNSTGWAWWQANGMDRRQIALHRAALGYGIAYETVVPGVDPITKEDVPVIRGVSPRGMIALYEDPGEDDWPQVAMRVRSAKLEGKSGYRLYVYDERYRWEVLCDRNGENLNLLTTDTDEVAAHGAPVVPVVRFADRLDLDGRADGEIEPFIPNMLRIDQTTFDRLVVQRFSSWVVRTISGMSRPAGVAEGETPTAEQLAAEKLRLRAEDILVTEDPEARFGSLPATPLDGYISAHQEDIHDLAATSQTPPHYLLGQMVNLSAEALAAAETTSTRKRVEIQHSMGEAHEQGLRLAESIAGNADGARDVGSQVVWADVESRSLAQAADALGKLAQMLGVPVEILWEKIPGWTQTDVDRAKEAVKEAGGLDALAARLAGQVDGQPPSPPPPAPVPAGA